MNGEYLFRPPRRVGMAFHLTIIGICLSGCGWGFWQASQADINFTFLLYLLPSIVAAALSPFFGYRAYALWRAGYILQRDGLRLHWGLRTEEIPMDAITGLYLDHELDFYLPPPVFRMPGAILGTRRISGLPPIEFMAAREHGLVLVVTAERVFAISPNSIEEFTQTYQRLMELGTLTPLPARSVRPGFLLSRFWADLPARLLLIAGLAVSLSLLVWVSITIPSRATISLRISPAGHALEPVPAVRLFLLPVINSTLFVVDLLAGLFFYRDEENRAIAYLLWASGIITSLLFLAAVYFILRAA